MIHYNNQKLFKCILMDLESPLCPFISEEYLKPHPLLKNSFMTGTGHVEHIRWYQKQTFKTFYKTQNPDGESNRTYKEKSITKSGTPGGSGMPKKGLNLGI